MKKLASLLIVFIQLLIFQSCGYREGVRQPDKQSYIWFSGNTEGAIAVVDGNEEFKVDLTYYTNSEGKKVTREGKTLYAVNPGKHEIMVKKNGEVVVHRVLIIDSGATKEVRVP